MLIRHLQHLTLVARHGSIAGAAASIPLAQPALSRELRELEEELGYALLVRERRGVALTAAGTALVEDARAILDRLDEVVAMAREAGDGRRGLVRLGLARLALDSPRIGQAIAAARARFPDVRLDVREISAFTSTQLLRTRQCDLTIASYLAEEHRGLRSDVLFTDVLDGVLLCASHRLAHAPVVTLGELGEAGLTFLAVAAPFQRGYSALMQRLAAEGITRQESHAAIEGIYALVAAGRGFTTAPHSIRAHPPRGTVVVPVRGLDLPLPIYLRRRQQDGNRAVDRIATQLLEALGAGALRARRATPRASARVPKLPLGIELPQLEAFAGAVEERSLSEAAQRLGITQPGVSRRIRALERSVGFPLLERVASGVAATPAGEVLYAGALEVQRAVQQALWRARRATGDRRAVCRIGALPPELTGGLQLLALQQMVELLPEVQFELTEMMPDEQVTALREHRIDVAVSGAPGAWRAPSGIAHVALTEDPVDCAMVPAGHRWESRAWVTWAELSEEPFLFIPRPAGPRLYDAVMRAFAEIGLTPLVGDTFGGPRSVWRAVADGMGWTIGARSQRTNPPRGLSAVPVEGLQLSWGVQLCWRREETDPLVRQVLEVFQWTRNPEVPVVVATVRASRGPASVMAP